MGVIVQKFGGTSVADSKKIKNVANAVIKEYKRGNNVIVVVSAMGHTTDYLVNLAGEISEKPSNREMDMLLATGEQVSIALLSMAIQEAGYPAVSLLASQIGIVTEKVHSKARILEIRTDKINHHLGKGRIIVAAGFQGVTNDNEITTLGRGGSDTTAVAIAAAIKAERCDIYTDVDGVYTADPRIVKKPSRLKEITYMEMLELARVGANVLHPRSVETAKQFNVPLRVRSSFKHDDLGTLVTGEQNMEIYKSVNGVAADLSQVRIAILKVPDSPGTAAKIFTALASKNISVDMIIQSLTEGNLNNIAFTVDESDLVQTMTILEKVKKEINAAEILIDQDVAKVSIVGAGMIDKPGIAADMFEALAEANINIKMISTSEIKISCTVDKNRAHDAVRVIHSKFKLDDEGIEIPQISL